MGDGERCLDMEEFIARRKSDISLIAFSRCEQGTPEGVFEDEFAELQRRSRADGILFEDYFLVCTLFSGFLERLEQRLLDKNVRLRIPGQKEKFELWQIKKCVWLDSNNPIVVIGNDQVSKKEITLIEAMASMVDQ